MALTGVSLDAASVVGPGQAIVPDAPKQNLTVRVDATGDPNAVIDLEGTVDFQNWFFLGTLSLTSGGTQSGHISSVGDTRPVAAGFRANLSSLSGGSSPTVTASIAIAG